MTGTTLPVTAEWLRELVAAWRGLRTGATAPDIGALTRFDKWLFASEGGRLSVARDVFAVLDAGGRTLFSSSSVTRALGYTREGLKAVSFNSLIHPADLRWGPFSRLGAADSTACEIRLRHQFRHWIEFDYVATQDNIGVVYLLARDTARKGRESISESRAAELFDRMFKLAPIGIAITDASGQIIETNRAFRELLGYSRLELDGRSFYSLTYPDDVSTNRALHDQLLDGTLDCYELTKRYLHRDGHAVDARLTVSFISDRNGQPEFLVGFIQPA
jgi:PAS domain S-box-containing protein